MARKRKRPAGLSVEASEPNSKRTRTEASGTKSRSGVYHPTLRLFYRRVQTLRAFLLSNKCLVPKRRRRVIAAIGKTRDSNCSKEASPLTESHAPGESERDLSDLLDQTLVCSTGTVSDAPQELAQIEDLTQQLSCSARSDPSQPAVSQAEVGASKTELAAAWYEYLCLTFSQSSGHRVCHFPFVQQDGEAQDQACSSFVSRISKNRSKKSRRCR